MVLFQLGGGFAEANNDRVNRGAHDAEHDSGEEQSHQSANHKTGQGCVTTVFAEDACKHVGVEQAKDQSDQAGAHGDGYRHHEQDVVAQVIGNDDRPAFVLEQLNDVAASFQETESIKTAKWQRSADAITRLGHGCEHGRERTPRKRKPIC